MFDISFARNNDGNPCSNNPVIYLLLPSSSVGTGFIIECMCFRENIEHAGPHNKLPDAFTAKILQYLQIKLCTGVYGLPREDFMDDRFESFHRIDSWYIGGQLIAIPDGPAVCITCPLLI